MTGDALVLALADLLVQRHGLDGHGRTVITLAGESGSGKSVTAMGLVRELSARGFSTGVLHQDDYFRLPPATNHANRERDLANVGPHEVDVALLRSHVEAFRAGARAVVAPRVDYPGNCFVRDVRDFSALSVLVVEGTYVVAHVPADVRIFMAATSEDTRERRKARNRDIDAPIVDQVLAIEHPIIAAQAALADIVVTRDFTLSP